MANDVPGIFDVPVWAVGLFVLAVIALATLTSRRRSHGWERAHAVKVCAGCGASLPPHARFCTTCGRAL